MLFLRLRGAVAAVEAACQALGGERVRTTPQVAPDWALCRDQRLPWFEERGARELWRLSRAADGAGAGPARAPLVEWHGGQRWVRVDAGDGARLRAAAARAGGHATLFAPRAEGKALPAALHALTAPLDRIHARTQARVRPGRHLQSRPTLPGLLRCKPISRPNSRARAEGREAEAILRKCVHCGFCTATCPTYQVLGDELDGPRGRIYLIKQVLEGEQPTRKTQLHLDRCLTCRNCESTCPSGVRLRPPGRHRPRDRGAQGAARRGGSKALRWTLKEGLTSPLFGPAMKLGQAVRGLLPQALKDKVPARAGCRRLADARRTRARC